MQLLQRRKEAKSKKVQKIPLDVSSHDGTFRDDMSNCLRCGDCCRNLYPTLNDNEIKEISIRSGMPQEDFVIWKRGNTYAPVEFQTIRKLPENGDNANAYACMFMEGGANKITSCSIYEYRPKECRIYPTLEECYQGRRKKGIFNALYEIVSVLLPNI